MKITIDTASDSHDHIRKIIALLKSLVGEVPETTPTNVFESPASSGSNVLSGFFESAHTGSSIAESPAPAPSVNVLKENSLQEPQKVDLWGNPKKDDDPPIEVY